MHITTIHVRDNHGPYEPGWYYQDPDTGRYVGPYPSNADALCAFDDRDPPPCPGGGLVVEELSIEYLELRGLPREAA